MISKSIIEKLREIYQSLPKVELIDKGDGWVNQYDFLRAVGKVGINYKHWGYEHFYEFLTDSGLFSFWTDFSGDRPTKYIIEKIKPQVHTVQHSQLSRRAHKSYADSEEVEKIKRRLRLYNNQFIGQFLPQKTEGCFVITDIRNTDFTKIEDKERGIKNLSIYFENTNKEIKRYAYYKFTWVLLGTSPIKFGIDLREDVIPIYPKDIVFSLYDGIMRYPAGAAKKIARSLDTLKKQLTQSGKEVFIYELLQNANDYPRHTKIDGASVAIPVEVEFHITKNYLIFQHTGEYFNAKNIAAICDINDGEKADNTEAIGYKGIGFKTVFLDNDYVLLNTGNYSFRFDKSATDVINTPWQILPIWTEYNEIKNEVKSIFRQHPNEEFRVKFALQPREEDILTNKLRSDNYIDLFTDVFDTERVILFIPNIKKVSIFLDGQNSPIVREKDNEDWCVSDALNDDIPEEITDKINDVLDNPDSLRSDGYEKIPEKYKNFRRTSVKFACKKDGRILKAVEDASLYCYLPAKRVDWGFNFLMNTDMVPNGQRDDIEDIELNHIIARIAGKQFFYWIQQLIKSEEYDLDSIFALIPDFDECKKRRTYKKFIEEFQEEFEKLLKEEPFIPVIDNGKFELIPIAKAIYDTSAISLSGILSDDEILSYVDGSGEWTSNPDEFFAHPNVRGEQNFYTFLTRYRADDMNFSQETILSLCESEEFNSWLAIEENNHKFLDFLLKNSHLSVFIKKNKKIFIGNNGLLYDAHELYENIDDIKESIPMFEKFIPHLSYHTCQYFADNVDWKRITEKCFKAFVPSNIITSYILPNKEAMSLLNTAINSVAFYRYLSSKGVDLKENSAMIPYITEDGSASTDYASNRYFFSDEVYVLTHEKWLGNNVINVLSHLYFEEIDDEVRENLTTLFARLGFVRYAKDLFITTVIVGDANFRANVNAAIELNYEANKAFVDYVFNSEAQLKDNSLKDYVLRCVDINGNEVYLCNDDVRYFNQDAFAQNSTYEDNNSHAWLQDTMMYALSNAYFEGCEKDEAKKYEVFLRQQFGIKTFTDKSFFTDVVIKNKTTIYASLVDEDSMLTFLKYLKRDADRLFDGSMSFNDIKDMPLLAYDGTVVNTREPNILYFEYSDEARVLCKKAWCPKTYIVLSQKYTDDFSQNMRQLFNISKFDINTVTDIISQSVIFRQSLDVVNNNIDFWRWVMANQKQIASVDKFKTISLIDKNNALTNSTSLYISDTYQQEQIETLVTKYVKAAQFVSSSYIHTTNDNDKAEWLKLFKKLGLKSDNKDILFSDILPNLATLDNDSLDSVLAMMTKHLKDLKDKWTERKHQIVQLRVRTQSGDYKTLDQVTIVNVDEDSVTEPFKYITLSNEVLPDILKANKALLLAISAEFGNRNLITTKQTWINIKVKDYLMKFASDENCVADIHIQFVREVAKIQNEYDIDSKLRKQIKYLVKSKETTYKFAHELTLGSAYSPTCDFEANGVTELSYLSNAYIFEGNKDIIKTYFKSENLHQNMTRDDLKHLANRTFACYFWSKCFSRRLSEYEVWIEEGHFNNRVCIPTENSVQKPELLYAPHIAGYAVRAKVPQWQEKVPYKAIVDSIDNRDARELFEKINFCKALSFEDCLYYLARVTHPREDESHYRSIVINWMLSSPNQDETMVDNYRKTPTAEWRNGKGQKKHITELYAIHPEASQERNIFRGDEFVMQTSAFPIGTDSFVKVCKMLKIKCLTSSDFVATPIGKRDETAAMVAILRPRLLVLSAIENPERFQELYERYNQKLSQYHFVVCEKIDLGYDTIHNDVERIYNDENHIYYVSSWKHNRTFTKFCSRLKRLIGIDVYDNVCEDVLDDSITVEDCIEKYCSSLAYDENFCAYLKSLDLTINVEPDEDEPSEVDLDYYSDATNELSNQINGGIDKTSVENSKVDNTDLVSETIKATEHIYDNTDNSGENELTVSNAEATINTSTKSKAEVDDTEVTKTTSSFTMISSKQHTSQSQTQSTEANTAPEILSSAEDDNLNQYDIYKQVGEDEIDNYEDGDVGETDGEIEDDTVKTKVQKTEPTKSYSSNTTRTQTDTNRKNYDPDRNGYMGSIDEDKDYQYLGDRPHKPFTRRHPKNSTKEEMERMRSHGIPLELESLPETQEEIDLLAQCNIEPEQIADTNYLAQLRLYLNLINEQHEEPEETMEEFVKNAEDVTEHQLKDGRYVHACSAARGVMYIGPTVWNKMLEGTCRICVYLDGKGKNFEWIDTTEEFLRLVEKDDVVLKITGKEKVKVVNALYTGLLENVKGTAYTLIRVASRTNMDAAFAHYVGAMAEAEDGNTDTNEYGD